MSLNGKTETDLEAYRGKKPVVLFFGSYSWPPFLRQVDVIEKLYKAYKAIAEFRIVYIREAHAIDSRRPVP